MPSSGGFFYTINKKKEITMSYVLELLMSEQRRCSKMIKAKKELIKDGYASHSMYLPKYGKQLRELNAAIRNLEKI